MEVSLARIQRADTRHMRTGDADDADDRWRRSVSEEDGSLHGHEDEEATDSQDA